MANNRRRVECRDDVIGTLWAGGWDDYLVDESDKIDVPESALKGNSRYFPTFVHEGRTYLKTRFSGKLKQRHGEKSAVRVTAHLGGGD